MGTFFEPPPGPEDPLGMLRACHRRLEARLDSLGRVAEILAEGIGERHDAAAAAIAAAIRHLDGAARLHVEDEEASVFPRLCAADPAATEALAGLAGDHAAIEAGWAALRPVLEDLQAALDHGDMPEPGTVERFRALLAPFSNAHYTHHAYEEREILPAAARALDAATLAAIGREMRDRRGGEASAGL